MVQSNFSHNHFHPVFYSWFWASRTSNRIAGLFIWKPVHITSAKEWIRTIHRTLLFLILHVDLTSVATKLSKASHHLQFSYSEPRTLLCFTDFPKKNSMVPKRYAPFQYLYFQIIYLACQLCFSSAISNPNEFSDFTHTSSAVLLRTAAKRHLAIFRLRDIMLPTASSWEMCNGRSAIFCALPVITACLNLIETPIVPTPYIRNIVKATPLHPIQLVDLETTPLEISFSKQFWFTSPWYAASQNSRSF